LRPSVRRGGTVSFAIRVTTSGQRAARGVRVCDRLPSGLVAARVGGGRPRGGQVCWTVGLLLPGRSRTVALVARALSVTRAMRVTNSATVSGTNFSDRGDQAAVRILASRIPGVTG
jgi:uncharacterized repeat protein (TIGR01451 family)